MSDTEISLLDLVDDALEKIIQDLDNSTRDICRLVSTKFSQIIPSCKPTNKVFSTVRAARDGNLAILKMYKKLGYSFSVGTAYHAGKSGNLDVVKFVCSTAGPRRESAFSGAVSKGNEEIIRWMMANKVKLLDRWDNAEKLLTSGASVNLIHDVIAYINAYIINMIEFAINNDRLDFLEDPRTTQNPKSASVNFYHIYKVSMRCYNWMLNHLLLPVERINDKMISLGDDETIFHILDTYELKQNWFEKLLSNKNCTRYKEIIERFLKVCTWNSDTRINCLRLLEKNPDILPTLIEEYSKCEVKEKEFRHIVRNSIEIFNIVFERYKDKADKFFFPVFSFSKKEIECRKILLPFVTDMSELFTSFSLVSESSDEFFDIMIQRAKETNPDIVLTNRFYLLLSNTSVEKMKSALRFRPKVLANHQLVLAECASVDIFQILLDSGNRISVRCIDAAVMHNNKGIAKLLIERGCKITPERRVKIARRYPELLPLITSANNC